MKNYYVFKTCCSNAGKWVIMLLAVLSISGTQLFAQRVITVDDGAILSDVINGDTTANGDRVDANTIYELKMNGIYYVAATISINSKLHIRSEGGGGFLPAILAQKDESNNWPILINNAGDITLEGVYLSNANGDEANPKWGGFRAAGPDSRVILKDCQFEFDKASTIQFAADGIKFYMDNCIASKTGNYREYNGNGRLVDTRGKKSDTIVVKNTTIYYMQDRLIRNMGGEAKYIEFDHVTVVNNQGFHGCFAMARVHKAKITNNLVINGMYGGDHPNTKEQTSTNPVDNEKIYMITMDTIYADSELEIHHNNFAYTADVIEFFNGNDTIDKPEVLAPTVAAVLGDAASAAYFEEVLEFTNMPGVPMDFLTSIYADPTAAQHPNNWPDEIGINNINAAYSTSSVSATASEDGKALGDPRWMAVGIFDANHKASNEMQLNVYPNPVKSQATFQYELTQASNVELAIYDITGKVVESQFIANQAAGSHQLTWESNDLSNGLYLYSIKTNTESVSGKLTLSK